MLKPRWRKVLRDLWGNKARTVLVVLSIAVGVFAVGMIAGSQGVFVSALNDAWSSVKPPSATLFTSAFDDELVWGVRKLPGVAEADARRSVYLRFKTDPSADTWRNLQVYVYPEYEDIRVLQVVPEHGAWPPPKNELLIERASLAWMGVQEGEIVYVEAPNGKLREMRVSGTVHDVSMTTASWTDMAAGYISVETLPWLGVPRSFNELSIIVAGDRNDKDHITVVAKEARDFVERTGREVGFTWIPVPGEHPAQEVVQPILALMGAMGFLALLLSGFLVINTLQALLAQQVRQIGIMKAVGAANGQIMGVYYAMVFAFCVLALGIGIPLGAAGGNWMTTYMASILNFDVDGYAIPLNVLLLEVAVGLIVPCIAALYPIISGVRVPARVAMSDYGLSTSHTGRGLLDRALERMRGVSRPVLLSLRNTFRRKGRLALTLTTLTLAGAIFIGVFSARAGLLNTLEEMFNYVDYDALVSFNRSYRADQIEQEALKIPGVVAAEAWRWSGARRIRPDDTESESIAVRAPRPDSLLVHPQLEEGRWLLPEDENAVVVNTFLLKTEPDIKVGDDIVLKIGDQETSWHVVGIMKGTPPTSMIYTTFRHLSQVEGGAGRAGVVFVKTDQHDMAFQERVAKALEKHYQNTGFQVNSTQTSNSERVRAGSQFNVLIMFLLIMAVLLAVVGGIGLMGTMSLNVLERTREIGVMRAIGASDGAILKIVIVEGMLIGMLSWFIGAVLAMPLSKVLNDIVGTTVWRTTMAYTYSVSGLVLWLVLVIVLSTLASAWPARNASRVTVRDVLAYE